MAHVIDAVLSLKDNFSPTLKAVDDKLQDFNKTWRRTGRDIQKTGRQIAGIGQEMTTKVTAPLAAAGAASFLMAADFEDSLGAVDQIFKASSSTVKDWSDSLPSYYGIAKDQALEYSSIMGSMLKNIGGLTETEAAKQSATLIELAGDLSAMYGGSATDAVYALTGALKGNNTMLDNYGMGVNEATIKTKALEMGLESAGGQLSLADKQAATLALIMEQTADAQGQAAREAGQASGSLKALKVEVKNLAIELGQVLLPIITPMVKRLGELAKRFGELDQRTKETIVKAAMFAAAIGPVLLVIGKVTMGIGGMVVKFAAFGKAVTKAGGLVKYFTALLSGPAFWIPIIVGLVIALAVAVVANWDKIKAKAEEVFPGIGEFFTNLGQSLRTIGGLFMELVQLIAGQFFGVLSQVFTALQPFIQAFGVVVMNTITTVVQILQGLLEFILGVFTGDWKRAWEGIKTIFSSIWDGIKDKANQVLDSILRKINDLLAKIGDNRIVNFLTGGSSANWGQAKTVRRNALGTNNFAGGLTWVHENGPEIMELPKGMKIYPHSRSLTMAYEDGMKNGVQPLVLPSAGPQQVVVNVTGENHFHTEADENRLVDKIVSEVGRELNEARRISKGRVARWNAV